METIVDFADWATWETLKAFANSNFFTSFIGALAGAWGGAYAVQRIADRAKRRDQLLQELRTCAAAIEVAHGIGSTYLNLKKQHVKGLREGYDVQRAIVHAFQAARDTGQLEPSAALHIGLDCQMMDAVRTRAAYLETLIQEKMSAPIRPRSIAVVLTRCTEQLNECIAQRNDILRRLASMSEDERVARMFGLPVPEGVDNSYRDYVHGIYQYTDDSIHFARMICDDVTTYGMRVRDRYQKTLSRSARRYVMVVPKVFWTDHEHTALMPALDKYSTWYTGFLYHVPHTRGRYLEKCWYVARKLWRKMHGSRKRK